MEYPYRTEIIWVPDTTATWELFEMIHDRADALADQNKTDGIMEMSGSKRVRQWATLEDAQEWIDWNRALPGCTVISAEIVSNTQ